MSDPLYNSIEVAIRKHYDRAGMDYDPDGKMRNTHMTLHLKHYRKETFAGKNGVELRQARDAHLILLQNIVDIKFGLI